MERINVHDVDLKMVYMKLLPEHLAISGDIAEPNRVGQRLDELAWIWHHGARPSERGNDWMDQCKSCFY